MRIEREGKLIGELEEGTLFKRGVDDSAHLMYRFGHTPGIDKALWEKNQHILHDIEVETKKGVTFKSTKENFNKHSFTQDFGYGEQLFMEREHWTIK